MMRRRPGIRVGEAWGPRNAGNEHVSPDQERSGRLGIPYRSAPPAHLHRLRSRRPLYGVEHPPDVAVPPFGRRWSGSRRPDPDGCLSRAGRPSPSADRLRTLVDPRRPAPAPVGHASGLAHGRHRTVGQFVSRLGPTRRAHRCDHLDPPPRPGGGSDSVAPARDRSCSSPRPPGTLVPLGRVDGGGVGTGGLGIRRSLRWDLRPRQLMVVRHPRVPPSSTVRPASSSPCPSRRGRARGPAG